MTDAFPRGRFVWYELMTSDPSAAQSFYMQLTGWTTKAGDIGDQPYTEWVNGGTSIGGVVPLPDELKQQNVPPHWPDGGAGWRLCGAVHGPAGRRLRDSLAEAVRLSLQPVTSKPVAWGCGTDIDDSRPNGASATAFLWTPPIVGIVAEKE